jgi:hypothetical protein
LVNRGWFVDAGASLRVVCTAWGADVNHHIPVADDNKIVPARTSWVSTCLATRAGRSLPVAPTTQVQGVLSQRLVPGGDRGRDEDFVTSWDSVYPSPRPLCRPTAAHPSPEHLPSCLLSPAPRFSPPPHPNCVFAIHLTSAPTPDRALSSASAVRSGKPSQASWKGWGRSPVWLRGLGGCSPRSRNCRSQTRGSTSPAAGAFAGRPWGGEGNTVAG